MRLALTPGEPLGIGPDLILLLAGQPYPAELIIVADRDLMQQRAAQLGLTVTLHEADLFDQQKKYLHQPGMLYVHHVPLQNAAKYVLATIQLATTACLQQRSQALITGPVNKHLINQAGIAFSGHTEYLAQLTQTSAVLMLLVSEKMRVATLTTHIPLEQVPQQITTERLTATIELLHRELIQKFKINQPRILVTGLNPHAGEGGDCGHEEIEIMLPVIQSFNQNGYQIRGPFPADTVFTPKYLAQSDAVLTMFHDQGLPVIKHASFGKTVNTTLGLPFIRTSVDHGTAFDLTGTGKANPNSLHCAIQLALDLNQS